MLPSKYIEGFAGGKHTFALVGERAAQRGKTIEAFVAGTFDASPLLAEQSQAIESDLLAAFPGEKEPLRSHEVGAIGGCLTVRCRLGDVYLTGAGAVVASCDPAM